MPTSVAMLLRIASLATLKSPIERQFTFLAQVLNALDVARDRREPAEDLTITRTVTGQSPTAVQISLSADLLHLSR